MNKLTPKENDRFRYLRHIPNFNKTDEEFIEYCELAEKVGIPEPNRNSKIRPLYEKYDSDGNLIGNI